MGSQHSRPQEQQAQRQGNMKEDRGWETEERLTWLERRGRLRAVMERAPWSSWRGWPLSLCDLEHITHRRCAPHFLICKMGITGTYLTEHFVRTKWINIVVSAWPTMSTYVVTRMVMIIYPAAPGICPRYLKRGMICLALFFKKTTLVADGGWAVVMKCLLQTSHLGGNSKTQRRIYESMYW